ncbi:MAG TPA: hypothetical protein VJR24_04840 [Gemmatimonadaceae bacterium]|nr:hypothetical protein [Gemmatimonadaceae bacterium]
MNVAPFFEKVGRPEQERARLLLISQHFPPNVAVGARRWEQFAQFIAERGWGLDVVMCREAGGIDAARMRALADGVRVFDVPEPSLVLERFEHWAARVYRLVFPRRAPGGAEALAGATGAVPDGEWVMRDQMRWPPRTMREFTRLGSAYVMVAREEAWARRAAALGMNLVRQGVHRAVVSSGPPHLAHEAARQVAAAARLPLIVDMRDPWSLLPMLHETQASPWWHRHARRRERGVVAAAALVIANTDHARNGLATAYPEARGRMITVLNGTDAYPVPPSRRGGRFTIGFAGTVYLEQDVRNLMRASADVIRDLTLTPADFGIDFIGDFGRPGQLSIDALAREAGVADYVSVGPRRAHAEALEFLAQATMLVVFVGFGREFIPAKTFEYMRFDAWLLALTEPESATAQLLQATDADLVVPSDVPAIASAIRRRYEMHRQGVVPVRVARDDRFSRAKQAEILLDAIERVSTQPPARRDGSALTIKS